MALWLIWVIAIPPSSNRVQLKEKEKKKKEKEGIIEGGGEGAAIAGRTPKQEATSKPNTLCPDK